MFRRFAVTLVALTLAYVAIPTSAAYALDYIWYGNTSLTGEVTDYGPSVFFSGDLYGDGYHYPDYPEPGYLIRERVEIFIFRDGAWKHVRAADTFSGGPNDRFSGWSRPGTVANSSEVCSYAVNTYSWHQFTDHVYVYATSTTCDGTDTSQARYYS